MRRIGPNLRLIPTSLYLRRDGRQLLCSTAAAAPTVAAATVTTAVNRGSRSSILPRWGRAPRRAAAKRPAVDAAVASAGTAANTAAKLLKLAVAESKDDDKVAADVNSIATTMAETRDIAGGPANPAHGEQKGQQDEHREEVLEAVDGTDMVTPVFESLLTDEMEMVEETIKEDQAVSSSSSIRQTVEEPADRLSEGKGGGEVVSEEEAKKDLGKEGGGEEGPTITAAATAATATAKEQRRQEKKKYSYSIPALCQEGRQLELMGFF